MGKGATKDAPKVVQLHDPLFSSFFSDTRFGAFMGHDGFFISRILPFFSFYFVQRKSTPKRAGPKRG
jgi:hypothetical protein